MRSDLPSTYQGQDKRLHFMAGMAIGLAAGIASRSAGESLILGAITATFFGAAKEALDAWAIHTREESQHRVKRADFTATVAGGIVGAAIAAALTMLRG